MRTVPTPAELFGRRLPVITGHALQRCHEMGVPVRVVQEIVDEPHRTAHGAATSRGTRTLIATRDEYPDWLVVMIPAEGAEPATVVTVAFQTGGAHYRRTSDGSYELLDEATQELVDRWSR